MDAVSFEIAGIVVRSPVTAGTNLILGVMCVDFYRRVDRTADPRTKMWRRFFLALAWATLAGALKHGFGYYVGSPWLMLATLVSSVSGGVSTYYAQRATLLSGLFSAQGRTGLLWFVRLQLLAFVLQIACTHAFAAVMMQTALGLFGVLVAEAVAAHRGLVNNWWTAAGFATALVSGLPYLARWPSSLWFNHIDLAHVIMAASFALIFLGTLAGSRSEVLQ